MSGERRSNFCALQGSILLVLLTALTQLHAQKPSKSIDVAIYNSMKEVATVSVKNKMEKISFDSIQPGTVSNYKSILGNGVWNITLTTKANTGVVLKSGHKFKAHRKTIIVFHEETGTNRVLFVDAGALVNQKEEKTGQKLGVDEAMVSVKSDSAGDLTVYWKSDNCYKCLDQILFMVKDKKTEKKVIGTKWPIYIDIHSNNASDRESCRFKKHFEEHGHYEVVVSKVSSKLKCLPIQTLKEPDESNGPILAMCGIYAGLVAFYLIWVYCVCKKRDANLELDITSLSKPRNFMSSGASHNLALETDRDATAQTIVKPKRRLQSLDAFRGVAITIMIFVNYRGGDYYFFEHSLWNGLTVADLVFPWFIFIMGTSIDMSQRSLLAKGIRKRTVFQKIVIRSVKLFAIGLFLNNGMHLHKWRVPGVLQRFGISYFFVATLSLWLSPSDEEQDNSRRYDWTDSIRDIWMFWSQWVIMITVLVIYLLITFLVHDKEKGCPRGYLGPGGIGDNGKYENCTGGAAGYIDRLVFGNNHMYGYPTCKAIYKTTLHYDPEGILGCLTSIFLTFLGLQSGRILFTYTSPKSRICRWLLWGLFWGVLTVGLTGGTKNEGVIPINKNLWSPTFVFATGSMAYILLAFMYFVIDIKKWWSGVPFTFAGMNAILLYCGHEVFHSFFPFNFTVHDPTHATILTRSAVGMNVWLIVAYYCYHEKIFFKV